MILARRIVASILCALPLAAALALLTEPRPAPAQIPGTANIQVGGTNIIGGTNGRCLYDNAGKVGETASCGLAGGVTIGASVITGGTNGRLLFDSSGVVGEQAVGTGVATALGTNVGTAGAFVVNGGALGTPSSGSVANSVLASMATTTIKGQTVGGSGAPVDLTATQAATILATVGGVLKTKLVAATYDLSLATGSQSITGCGFAPTAAVVITSKSGASSSVGLIDSANGTASINQPSDAATPFPSSLTIQYTNAALSAQQQGVASLAADGVSISWTKVGAPSGTLNEYVLCLR